MPNLRKQVDALNPAFDEMVIVDDGSADGTVAKARELGFDIKALGKNRGPGGARNAAFRMASAEWVHFLDADDEIAPDYLAKVLPLVDDATDIVLSACDFVGATDRKFWVRWSYEDTAFRSNALAAAIARPVFLHCSFVRRTKALEAGGFDEDHRCYEDGDFHVRLAAAGARFRCIPDVLAISLRHSEGSGGNELYCAQCRLDFLKEYRKYLGRIPAEALPNSLAQCGAKLHRRGDVAHSCEAFDLAFSLGWKGADTKHPVLRVLNAIPVKALRRRLYLKQYAKRTGSG